MADLPTRRQFLYAAVQQHGRPVTTQLAARLMTGSPWASTGRNTARKDLRGLARAGLLAAVTAVDGRTTYYPAITVTDEVTP
ncbi:hypothetical protein KVH27_19315 [Streptomyces olivaceus]|uniref:hypothetical protein n=1 Tax=Streptomyces olivaceus TaxID=47716 RepID=UPI001CCDF22C|nr:hypothetical protein [Streptomyces olivaceus]MBZ6250517.1 hypothetical protein [Streptomyces olivaceus]